MKNKYILGKTIGYKYKTYKVTLLDSDFVQAHLVKHDNTLSSTSFIIVHKNGKIEKRESRTMLEKHRYNYKSLSVCELHKIIEECLIKSELKNSKTREFKGTAKGKEFRYWQTRRNNARAGVRKFWKLRKNKEVRNRIKNHVKRLRECNNDFFDNYNKKEMYV